MAFTLAETLIVMGIIGVVAALTLPNLNSSTGDKEKVAKVKKIYSNLEDAYGRATAVYGPLDEWFKNDTTDELENKRFGERMTEFMKVSKTCGTGDGCFSSNPLLDVDGLTVDANYLTKLKSNKAQMYILADGTALALFSKGSGFYEIKVDIDGPNKGRNQIGNDIFDFTISF
ncbi:type II secretion system protein, partial [bacterium]|nr:type II secretion system protein [bacterium]